MLDVPSNHRYETTEDQGVHDVDSIPVKPPEESGWCEIRRLDEASSITFGDRFELEPRPIRHPVGLPNQDPLGLEFPRAQAGAPTAANVSSRNESCASTPTGMTARARARSRAFFIGSSPTYKCSRNVLA